MEELRNYLNSLPVEQQKAYASGCGTSLGYLRKAISINQKIEAGLARRLDEHSGGQVKKQNIRPDVWPELVAA